MAQRRMLAAIVFTDIQGYTRLMNERESLAMECLKVHNKVFDELSAKYSGLVIKSIGDSYLIEFPSAVNAVQCALEAQDEFAKRNRDIPEKFHLKVKVSIHVGDVIVENEDVHGDGVNVASRLQSVTPGGAICLSREAFAQVKSGFRDRFASLGELSLKGLAEPMEVFITREFAPAAARPASSGAALSIVVPETSRIRPDEEPAPSPAIRPLSEIERRVQTERTVALPPPPPAPALGHPGPTFAAKAIFAALFLFFFGKPWLSAGHADWLGGGCASALILAALTRAPRRSGAGSAFAFVLYVGAAFAFIRLGAGFWPPAFEVGVAAGLGVIVGGAAYYLGFLDPHPDRRLSLALLLASTLLLMAAGCAWALPTGMPWTDGIKAYLAAQAAELSASGGGWRWGGFGVLYVAWRLAALSSFDPAEWSRRVGADGRQLNWNR